MYASCFHFGDWETFCVSPTSNFSDALLQLVLSSSHIFSPGSDAEVVNIEVILNSRSETLCDAVYFYIEQCHRQNTLLGDSSSCLWRLEMVDLTRIQNFLSKKKLFMKLGNLPRSRMQCKSFIILNFQVML